jgi:hypothetical protein
MLSQDDIQLHADRIRNDGYTVVEHAVDPALVEGLKDALLRIEREHSHKPSKTSFEGFNTLRINNLLTYGDMFWEVPLHDSVLPVVEKVLDKERLLSSFCSLVLGPGQQAQPMPERLPEPEYDSTEIVRTVPATKAYVSFKGKKWKVPQAFCGERLAIRPASIDGKYGVFFAAHQVATIDLTSGKSVGHVSEQVSAMSPV